MVSSDRDDSSGFSERRESDRKKLIVEVYFEGGDATGIANTTDISLGGVFMTTSAFFEIGQPVAIRITVDGRRLNLDAEIAYTEAGRGVGVSFTDLSGGKKAILEKEFGLK